MDKNADIHQWSRRHFLSTAVKGSAIWMASSQGASGMDMPAIPASYAVLHSLPPGAIQPEGWLRMWLERQASELAISLPRISEPFKGAYWAGDEKSDSWWAWEDKGYWTDGAIRCALAVGDRKLLRSAQAAVYYTLSHPAPNGYLGPLYLLSSNKDCYRFPHTIFFRAMAATSEANGDTRIVEAIRQHYLGGDSADYGVVQRNVTNIEAMLWCYQHSGDSRLLTKAEQAWSEYLTHAGDKLQGDLAPARVFADTPINAHGITYAETCKLPALLYMHTGNGSYLKFALAAQKRIFDHHMLVDGIPSTSEWFHGTTALDAHETCDIADHTWSWGYMLMATGNGSWGDHVERACFNAGFGAIKKDWKALQYFSCTNQVLATLDSNHTVEDRGTSQMAYQPNPGHHVSCCAGNVHRIHPNYALRMWMRHGSAGLAATLYGPSRVKTMVGANRQPIEIVQTTNYPFEDTIRLTFHSSRPVRFPLYLRIPQWCKNPAITVNGKPLSQVKIVRNFAVLRRTFHPGDAIVLTFPMKIAATHWPGNGVAVERGPLVYTLPIEAKWTSAMEQPWSTPDFPEWIANPVSEWNYGLTFDPAHPEVEMKFHHKPVAGDPWLDPPVSIEVSAIKINDWKMQKNPKNPDQSFTPPLPDIQTEKPENSVERIKLVPYGSTHLRLTVFPTLASTSVVEKSERRNDVADNAVG